MNTEQELWQASQMDKLIDSARKNPLVRLYGKGPDGEKCKRCVHLFRHLCGKTYFKCDLRTFTRGPGSDHKANWTACAKFQAVD